MSLNHDARKKMKADNSKKATILVVDDELANLTLLVEYLKQFHFQAITLQSGKEVVEQSKVIQPDLIILDVMMPGIDGFEICSRLKADTDTKDIPVMFMTGLSNTDHKLKGFEVGAVDYITKPFRPKEFIARIQTHITLRKQQKQLQQQNIRFQEQHALIEQQRRQLRDLNARKDKFISLVSQDLQQPFSGIFISSERIRQAVEQQRFNKLPEITDQLQTAVENYQTLLENLLNWAKVQQGLLKYQPQAVDLNLIIVKHLALFRAKAEQKQISLTTSNQQRTMAYADVKMLDIIVQNLLSNAIKFTPAGGAVDIAVTVDKDAVKVSVSDTGIGIETAAFPKLFRIDMKYQRPGTSEETGTGLGLTLCKACMEKHGGQIEFTSEIGKGSTFSFTLPHQAPAES
jgi:signal transduction histidine kinase